MKDRLRRAVEARTDELVALTADSIRFPTVNPPGEAYRPCAEYLGERLRSGFAVELHPRRRHAGRQRPLSAHQCRRAASTGGRPAPACISIRISTWSRPATAGPSIPFAGVVNDGKVYGRGACDMKGGLGRLDHRRRSLHGGVSATFPAPSRFPARSTRSPAASAASPTWRELGYFSQAAGRSRHHPRAAEQGPHLPWPSRRLVGRDRDQGRDRAWLDAVPRRQCACATWARCCRPSRTNCSRRSTASMTRMPVVPEGASRSTMNINSIHGGQTEDFRPGLPSPNVPDSCRLTIDRRFLLEEDIADGQGRGDGDSRPAEARAARNSTTRSAT